MRPAQLTHAPRATDKLAQLTNAPRSTDKHRISHPMCTGKTVAWYSEHSDDAAIWQRADAARLQQLREST